MKCNCMDMLSENIKKKYIILNERLLAISELKNIDISLLIDDIDKNKFNRSVIIREQETMQQLKTILNL